MFTIRTNQQTSGSWLGFYFGLLMYRHLKLGTQLSTHRSVPHQAALNGVVWCESGYYCECVCMRRICSWFDMRDIKNTAVRRRGNRNGKKAVHTEHIQNNAHFDGPTTIRSGPCSAWACSECIFQVVCVIHNGGTRQFGTVRCDVVWTCVCSSLFPALNVHGTHLFVA